MDTSKVYKIKYTLNLLPLCSFHIRQPEKERLFFNEDTNFSQMCSETEELEIFSAPCVQSYLEYKWETYAIDHHKFGFLMHCFYVVVIHLYVYFIYIDGSEEIDTFIILLIVGILYPFLYDFSQLIRGGLSDYLSDPWNYADMVYIYGSITNIIIQKALGP